MKRALLLIAAAALLAGCRAPVDPGAIATSVKTEAGVAGAICVDEGDRTVVCNVTFTPVPSTSNPGSFAAQMDKIFQRGTEVHTALVADDGTWVWIS
jgi:hypothetical protein